MNSNTLHNVIIFDVVSFISFNVIPVLSSGAKLAQIAIFFKFFVVFNISFNDLLVGAITTKFQ